MPKPYLSSIVVGRNDNYGGDFLHRFQVFINNQLALWERYKLPAELIIVEWNPPDDKPRFKDVLRIPANLVYASVRIIEVSPTLHQRFPKADRIKLFEYVGKNVGMRRSVGEYVLTTNTDLIYAPELVKFFAERKLDSNALYRVDRADFDGVTIPLDVSPEEQIKLAQSHLIYTHNPYGAAFLPGESMWGPRNARRILTYIKNRLVHFPAQAPYTNAAGDFFLMHHSHWEYLRGFPELEHYNFPDAMCYMALARGLHQVTLRPPLCMYHKDHMRGGPETGRPLSDGEVNKKRYIKMLRARDPWRPNGEDWGLNNEKLPEIILSSK